MLIDFCQLISSAGGAGNNSFAEKQPVSCAAYQPEKRTGLIMGKTEMDIYNSM